MKDKSSKNVLYAVLLIVIISLAYVANKDITPEQTRTEKTVQLKLDK